MAKNRNTRKHRMKRKWGRSLPEDVRQWIVILYRAALSLGSETGIIHSIAKIAGVSDTTVRNVLQDSELEGPIMVTITDCECGTGLVLNRSGTRATSLCPACQRNATQCILCGRSFSGDSTICVPCIQQQLKALGKQIAL